MEWTILQLALHLFVVSVTAAEGGRILKEYSCPESFTCAGCPANWIYPNIDYSGKLVGDACDVTFTWNWEQQDDINPLLVFICTYDDGSSCDLGYEQQCGSCQNFTIVGVEPNKNPVVSYSDTCGNMNELPIGESCSATTVVTTELVTETTTSGTKTSTPTPGGETTASVGSCPDTSMCSGCPLDWESPDFQLSGTPLAGGLCNVELTWSWGYPSDLEENPVMNFLCIYGANGEFCETNSQSACGSCQTVSFDNVDLSYHPYIDFADTCGILNQIYLSEDCSNLGVAPPQTTSPSGDKTTAPSGGDKTTVPGGDKTTVPGGETTSPPSYCPEFSECSGCPSDFVLPTFNQEATVVAPDNCTVDFIWDWPYSADEEPSNLRMVFLCVFGDGNHCQPLDENVCGSCEKFTIANIQPSRNPEINYSDTCGNVDTISITVDCQG